MIDHLSFGSCYVFAEHGISHRARESRAFRSRLERGDERAIVRGAAFLLGLIRDGSPLGTLFGPDAVLVPTPGAMPRDPEDPWVSERLAQALCAIGLGKEVAILLRRRPIEWSGDAKDAQVLTEVAQHYRSIRVTGIVPSTPKLVLVDDMLTRGETIVAAASRLKESYPKATVSAFALMRYRGLIEAQESMCNPCFGIIRWDGTRTYRPA